jgi:hypothetical protein
LKNGEHNRLLTEDKSMRQCNVLHAREQGQFCTSFVDKTVCNESRGPGVP